MGCWTHDYLDIGLKVFDAQQRVADNDPMIVLVDSYDGLTCNSHFDDPSQIIVGQRLAVQLLTLLKESEHDDDNNSEEKEDLTIEASDGIDAEETEAPDVPWEEEDIAAVESDTIIYAESHRTAWIIHGALGAITFGLLIPTSISSALLRDWMPQYWVYVHVSTNLLAFVFTIATVGKAFTNMNRQIPPEGHFQELHQIIGLLLMLIVSFQVGIGFLRPPNESSPPVSVSDKSMTARALWYVVHSFIGLIVFGLGAYQVQSGLKLFSDHFGTANWGPLYISYVCLLVGVIVIAKLCLTRRQKKGRELKEKNPSLEMSREHKFVNPESELT